MTYLSATAIMIDTFGRDAALSTNPEMDMALRAGADARRGGPVAWLRRTAIGKALAARKAARDLNRAVARLAELSPHLLADIGILDIALVDADTDLSIRAQADLSAGELRATAVPVALRPAQRPAIHAPLRAPAAIAVKPPVRAARKEQPAPL